MADDDYKYDNLTQKLHLLKGQILIQGKNLFREGMLEFDKAIQINPENKDMWRNKILNLKIYQARKKETEGKHHPELSNEVIKCCDKLLSIDKDHLETWLWKAVACFSLKRFEDTLECEDNVLRLVPLQDDFRPGVKILALNTKANCYYYMERPTEAKKCLLEVLRLDPYHEEALETLHHVEIKIADRHPSDNNGLENKEDISSFCENCGNALKPEAKFCGKCGTPAS